MAAIDSGSGGLERLLREMLAGKNVGKAPAVFRQLVHQVNGIALAARGVARAASGRPAGVDLTNLCD